MAGVKAGPVVEADVDPVTADVDIGGYVCAADPVAFNDHRPVTRLTVRNTGDRPVQIGSHFHFFEVNRALEFDRPAAFGQHLKIPTSTALRFEPGDEREGRDMEARFPDTDVVLIESGGDNLTLTFSPALVDFFIYVIDVAAGDKIPRRTAPGLPSRTFWSSTRPIWPPMWAPISR